MEAGHHSFDLSLRELISLYMVLANHESELDDVQQRILGRLRVLAYENLSVEQIEHLERFYKSL